MKTDSQKIKATIDRLFSTSRMFEHENDGNLLPFMITVVNGIVHEEGDDRVIRLRFYVLMNLLKS